jgi:hypothetical protein
MRGVVAVLAAVLVLAGCGSGNDDAATTSETTSTSAPPGPPRGNGVDKDPLGEGRHTLDDDAGWVYFRTPAGQGCAIAPIGRVVGCDFVPAGSPPGTNQTVVENDTPAVYRSSPTPTYTRDVDVLPVGHRLTNGATRCAILDDGAVQCEIAKGAHGFIISAKSGQLW